MDSTVLNEALEAGSRSSNGQSNCDFNVEVMISSLLDHSDEKKVDSSVLNGAGLYYRGPIGSLKDEGKSSAGQACSGFNE